MTITAFLEVLTAFLKFPAEVTALVRVLSKTPEEKHADLIKQVNDMFSDVRPKW